MGKSTLAYRQFMIIIDTSQILSRNVNFPNILKSFEVLFFFKRRYIYIYIYKMIKNFDPNKGHDHDMISSRILQFCGISVCKRLEIIFPNCLRLGKFSSEWKKANVVSNFKKGEKQLYKKLSSSFLSPDLR